MDSDSSGDCVIQRLSEGGYKKCPISDCGAMVRNLVNHYENVHDKIHHVSCDNCGKMMRKASLSLHKYYCSPIHRDRYRCTEPNCNKTFFKVHEKTVHVLQEHPQHVPKDIMDIQKELVHIEVCGDCRYALTPGIAVRDHRRACTGKYHCLARGCSNTFARHDARELHTLQAHPSPLIQYKGINVTGDPVVKSIDGDRIMIDFVNAARQKNGSAEAQQAPVQKTMCYSCKVILLRSRLKQHLLECVGELPRSVKKGAADEITVT